MATQETIDEVREMFVERAREIDSKEKAMSTKQRRSFINHPPTDPEIWLDVWHEYGRSYTNGLPMAEIKRRISQLTILEEKKAEELVEIAMDCDMFVGSDQSYLPPAPDMRPELYFDDVSKYIDEGFWAKFWDDNDFSKTRVISNEEFDKALQQSFKNKNKVRAIKELGLVANLISKVDNGIIYVGLESEQ